jgi:hypothetical protein
MNPVVSAFDTESVTTRVPASASSYTSPATYPIERVLPSTA